MPEGKNAVYLDEATTKEIVDELRSRFNAIVVLGRPKVAEDGLSTVMYTKGWLDTLVGMCSIAATNLASEMVRSTRRIERDHAEPEPDQDDEPV